MKLSLSDLLVPLIIVGAAGWWGYSAWSDHAEKARAELARQNESAAYERAVGAMAARHGATPALTDKLAASGNVYTYQVQNALLAATGRAVSFGATVADLKKSDGAYLLELDAVGDGPPAVHYLLECDALAAQKIMGANPPVTRVMIVATISAVERAEPSAPVAGAGGRYLAKGRCLELVTR